LFDGGLEDGIDLLYTQLTPYCIYSSQCDVDDAVRVCVVMMKVMFLCDRVIVCVTCTTIGVSDLSVVCGQSDVEDEMISTQIKKTNRERRPLVLATIYPRIGRRTHSVTLPARCYFE
jgi:hypothetical protein